MTQITGATSQAERPFFRYDLQTTAIEEGGNRYVDVTAPNGGESFRFYEVEYAVACGMDGERDVESIVRWAKSELDLQTTSDEVAAIVAKLAELNYIEGGQAVAAAQPAAAAAQPAAADDFELGDSGKAAREPVRPERIAAAAADLELGHAGSTEAAPAAARPSIDSEFELGVAGNEGAVPVDEVAVAQAEAAAAAEAAAEAELAAAAKSAAAAAAAAEAEAAAAAAAAAKVITPAEVPAEVNAAVSDSAGATPELVAESSDISDSIAEEADPVVDDGKEAIAIADTAENEAKRQAALAKEEELAKKRAERRPMVRRSASIVLWLILLGTVAGGAYYYFFHTEYVLEHPADQPLNIIPILPSTAPPVEVPAELAPPSTMTVTEIPVADATAARAGVVEWVADPGSEVEAGDVILKIKGGARFAAAVAKESTALEKYQLDVESDATKADPAKLAAAEANVARKEADLETAKGKLAPFQVVAPIDGVVALLVKALDKVKVDQAVGKVTGKSKTIAVFTLAEGNFAAEDEEYTVASVDDPELTTTCVVSSIEEQEITLHCPSDSGIEADAAVKLVAP